MKTEGNENKKIKMTKSVKWTLIALSIVIVAVAVLIATGVIPLSKSTEETQPTTTETESLVTTTQGDETTTQTETTTTKTEKHSDKETIDVSKFTDEYVRIIEQHQEALNNPDEQPFPDPIYKKYSIYDIDNDGVPELLIRTGESESEHAYFVYTIKDKKAIQVGEFKASNAKLFEKPNENGMLALSNSAYRISIKNGKVVSEYICKKSEMTAKKLKADKELKSVDAIDFSLLFDVMGDKGTQNALSKEEAKKLFIKANNLYNGWIIYGRSARKCMDDSDGIYIGDNINKEISYFTHYRIVSDEYKSKDELEAALSSTFTKLVYKEIFDARYVTAYGKMYAVANIGEGGDWTATKVQIEMISANNSVCKFRINGFYTDEEIKNGYGSEYTPKGKNLEYTMYKINGNWLIHTDWFIVNEQIYDDNAVWVD